MGLWLMGVIFEGGLVYQFVVDSVSVLVDVPIV